MNWINNVPIDVPVLANLSWGILLWSFMFLVAGIYFTRLTIVSLNSYKYLLMNNEERAVRLFALGRIISQIDSLLVVAAGLGIGIFSAANPKLSTPSYLTTRETIIIVLFLLIPFEKMMQAIITEQVYKIAMKALTVKEIK